MQASSMKGKAALVTGASGALGRAAALKLAEAGADIFLVDSDADKMAQAARDIRAHGVKVHVRGTDLTNPDDCISAVNDAARALGRLDALCNVANAFLPSPAETVTKQDWQTSLAINLTAPFFLMQAAIPHLIETHGAIVNVSSAAAFTAQPKTAAYSASKAGMAQVTKMLAKEYVGRPIRINLIAPGSMSPGVGSHTKVAPGMAAAVQLSSPGRANLEVDEVADVIAFLASDAARGFHGSCVVMDNGISI